MTADLKPCRWRSPTAKRDRIACSSNKIAGAKHSLPLTICEKCPYTDHAPVAAVIPITWHPCIHRGERRLHPPEAPDNIRDWRPCDHPDKPLGEAVCQCRGCSPQCRGYVDSNRVQVVPIPQPDEYVAPLTCSRKWMGRAESHAAIAAVSVVICHLNTIDDLELGVAMWRAQTIKPYIIIIDTGSPSGLHARLEKMRGDDCEIHYIRTAAYVHSSAPVGVAMDLAFTVCPSQYLFSTHSDVYPRRQDFLEWMLGQCSAKTPVIGWQMSPRENIERELWAESVSHTATIWHADTMRAIGLRWDFRWWFAATGESARPGWPDTESPPNLCLQLAGISPVLLGPEPNHELHETHWFWHARSQASVRAYGNGSELCRRISAYGDEARRRAAALLAEWRTRA